jgi:hypothetical protein
MTFEELFLIYEEMHWHPVGSCLTIHSDGMREIQKKYMVKMRSREEVGLNAQGYKKYACDIFAYGPSVEIAVGNLIKFLEIPCPRVIPHQHDGSGK